MSKTTKNEEIPFCVREENITFNKKPFISNNPADYSNWLELYANAPEKNSGEIKVNKTGYVPANIRIENLIMAGATLAENRGIMYDYNENQDSDESDEEFDLSVDCEIKNDTADCYAKAYEAAERMRANYKKHHDRLYEKRISEAREKEAKERVQKEQKTVEISAKDQSGIRALDPTNAS